MFLAAQWRLRYTLSLRDLAEMFLVRGFVFSHRTVRQGEAPRAPLQTETVVLEDALTWLVPPSAA